MAKEITFTTVTSPQYANAAKTSITCIVQFSHLPKPVPFTASANDPSPHGKKLYEELVAGKFGSIANYSGAAKPVASATTATATEAVVSSVHALNAATAAPAARTARPAATSSTPPKAR